MAIIARPLVMAMKSEDLEDNDSEDESEQLAADIYAMNVSVPNVNYLFAGLTNIV